MHSKKFESHPIDVVQIDGISKIGSDADAVVFTDFSSEALDIAKKLKLEGVRRYYDHNEAILDFEGVVHMLREMDIVFCCSEKLKEITEEKTGVNNCKIVEDTYELARVMA